MKLDDTCEFDVTGWFPASINPVHIGFYQVHTPKYRSNHYSFWTGEYWEKCTDTARHNLFRYEHSRDMRGLNVMWRGLAQPQ